MSTATIAAVRPLSEIKADFAAAATRKGFVAQGRDALYAGPKKAAQFAESTARFVKADTALSFLINTVGKFNAIVGTNVARVWALTSHPGQATLRWAARTAYKVSKWSLRTVWKIGTWPLRQWSKSRQAVEAIERNAKKLTMPEHNPLIVPVSVGAGFVGAALSADRWYMKAANLVASVLVFSRMTRRFIPAGPWRFLAYVVEVPFFFSKMASVFPNTTERIVDRVANGPSLKEDAANRTIDLVDEVADITQESAEKAADAADAAALEMEGEVLRLQEKIDAQHAEAARMRDKAEALAAAATNITEDVQPEGGVAVVTTMEKETEVKTTAEVVVPDPVVPAKDQDNKKPSPANLPRKEAQPPVKASPSS